jgi:D-glycero-alpha-D-manno-heptose 1-phosphate guanylyltransferase
MNKYPVIILAGGFGTRLKHVISDIPKPMAPVNGKPFLHYLFLSLSVQEIKEVVLSVGYKSNVIEEYFGVEYLGIKITYAREEQPLGTGGGIKQAFQFVEDHAYVLNGDTFFDVNLNELSTFYFDNAADIALALKPMKNFDRYGTVVLNQSRISAFAEKKPMDTGLINGGVYFFGRNVFDEISEQKFSFEKDVLEKYVQQKKICGKIFDNYFIDIGIPEDYAKVQSDFAATTNAEE